MVQLSDYQNMAGLDGQPMFGQSTSIEDLNELNKALSAQQITGRETTGLTNASGAPLKVESLEKTLKVLEFNEKDIVFWQKIPKSAAFNTVEEYNQLTSYGADRGGFTNEGELPIEEDSTYVRRSQLVKFLGVTKSVTHPMTLVNTMIGSAIEREAKNGTLWILRKLDRALYTGNADLIPQEFNGIVTQHSQNHGFASVDAYTSSEVIVDLRGDYLKEQHIQNAANGVIVNYGRPDTLYAPPIVLNDFVKNFYGNKFIQPNTQQVSAGVMGQRVKSFESQFGNIDLNYDIFFNPPPYKVNGAAATSTNAPANPVPDGTTPVAAIASDASGKWVTTDAGAYYFAVVSINRYGESGLVVLNSGATVSIVSGGAADLKFTSGGGANPATMHMIYRSQKNPGTLGNAKFYPIFAVTDAQITAGYDGGAAGLVRDRNRFMTNCSQAFLVQNDDEVIEFKQLAPLMKMDLAVISPAYRFMVLMYGTPFLYAPRKMVRFINIGVAS